MNTSCNPPLPIGKRIEGKWNGACYRLERELGEGANGKVYLVSRDKAYYAMKVGTDTVDLQAEANVLTALSRLEGSFRRFLVDVDDFHENGQDYSFYVMKYIRGLQLQDYLAAKGREWFPLVGYRILNRISELHKLGFIFGDLKQENVLVSDYGHVELVDFGGVTPMGRSVRQFTELYDRGCWDAGTRKADEAYDLFSFAILCVHICGGAKSLFSKNVLPQNRTLEALLDEISRDRFCEPYRPFLVKALRGEFASSRAACGEWGAMMRHWTGHKLMPVGGKLPTGWVKGGFAASLLLFAGALWYYW